MQKKYYSIEKILENLKIESLNEMQHAAIAAIEKHKEIILLSSTGSGKTVAFLLPMLQQIDFTNKLTQAIIIVPTRELAQQIELVFKTMATGLKVTCCYGGHLRLTEENNLIEPPVVLIGTPGRLADHIRRGNIATEGIQMLILDEFDKSLELGFEEEMGFIINALPNINKKILTSATMTEEIPDFIKLVDTATLNFLNPDNSPSDKLTIKTLLADEKDKTNTLFKLIYFLGGKSAIIFLNHREAVERCSKLLTEKGITNVFYHGALEQQERDAALCKFRNGTADILISTDLASRGLDIPFVKYIIHYHLPLTQDAYIHRNGRTARADAGGTAIIVLSAEEKLPEYVLTETEQIELPQTIELPDKPKWTTLFIAAGKKDKVNKIDIVGFLANKGQLKKDDIGLIEVKDFFSFVAIRKSKLDNTMKLIHNEKIKNQKVRISIAK